MHIFQKAKKHNQSESVMQRSIENFPNSRMRVPVETCLTGMRPFKFPQHHSLHGQDLVFGLLAGENYITVFFFVETIP